MHLYSDPLSWFGLKLSQGKSTFLMKIAQSALIPISIVKLVVVINFISYVSNNGLKENLDVPIAIIG